MWQGVLSPKNIQKLDYLEIINTWNYSQHMSNRSDYLGQFFLKINYLKLSL